MLSRRTCLLAVSLALLCAQLSPAQVTTATLFVDVTDPTGATVPDANVKATNTLTGATVSGVSNAEGLATLQFLPVGAYTLSVAKTGFQSHEQSGLDLVAGQRLRLTVQLGMQSVSEKVNVTTEMPLVNTASAEEQVTLGTRQVRELPLMRRDWTGLMRLGAGVTLAGNAVSLNGLAPSGVRVTVDGTDASGNASFTSLGMYMAFNVIKIISLEAISEVNVTKGIAPAEVGATMSGNVNLIARSGTNEFHGSLFHNYQSGAINARAQFASRKPQLVFNQFGGSLGGPVVKNKLFFFGTYEGYRQSSRAVLIGNVPTQSFRDRAIAAVPAYKTFFDMYPLPNAGINANGLTGVYQGLGASTLDDNHVVGRGDWYITDNNRFSTRYTRGKPNQLQPRVAEANNRLFNGKNEAITSNFTHTSASWTAETRYGYLTNDVLRLDSIYNLGVPGIVCCFGFGDAGETWLGNGGTQSIEQVVAMTRSKHSFKFGAIFARSRSDAENVEVPEFQFPTFDDLLANRPSTIQVTWGNRMHRLTYWQLGGFVQDDYRVTSRLTVNAGLRYDYFSVPRERENRYFNRDEPFGLGPIRPGNSVYNGDFNNFAPRLGFSWQLDENSRTVLRGGFGVFVSRPPLNSTNIRNALDEPVRVVFSRIEAQNLGLRYPVTNEQVLPLVKNPNAPWVGTALAANYVAPYSLQWNLGVQRQLTNSVAIESSYVANRGLKLYYGRLINSVDRVTGLRPFAGFGEFRYYDTSDMSTYHSWQNTIRKRFSRGLTVNGYYTYASNISYQGADVTGLDLPQDSFNMRPERGPTPFDVRHRFTSDFIYEPQLTAAMGWTSRTGRLLLDGWQIGGVVLVQTGLPFNRAQGSAIGGQRPDFVGGSPYTGRGYETLQYLNPAAFAKVPISSASGAAIRPGTLGRNALRLPGFWNADISLAKNLYLSERMRLQLRVDAANAFNHTVMSAVSNSIDAGNFGRFVGTRGARSLQFNGRLTF